MKHRKFGNPDSLKDVAVDSGMAIAAGAGAAALLGLGIAGVREIKYGTDAAPTAPQTANMYRVGLLSLAGALVGGGMQYGGPKVAGFGKALLVLSAGVPVAALVAGKVSDAMLPASPTPSAAAHAAAAAALGGMYGSAMLPAPPAAAPPTNPSQGMFGMGGWSPSMNRSLPSGFAADNYSYAPTGELISSLQSPSYIPPAR